jgi:hypothetical protein
MHPNRMAALLFCLLLSTAAFASRFPAGAPATTDNDDSCDIGLYPAATLLLPYFEVEYDSPRPRSRTTIFTITNVSRLPQIVRVTLWTDYGFPIIGFNLFLTGYDVQVLDLYDVIGRGVIAARGVTGGGTSNATTPGSLSLPNGANPNFASTAGVNCGRLPGLIPPQMFHDLRSGLSAGTISSCGTARVGSNHGPAIASGYATVDVVADCTNTMPTDARYFDDELLYDNVLLGDYQRLDPDAARSLGAGGNPMVHIRAVPEGGRAGELRRSNLPYTFYDRFTAASGSRKRDRRQPLSSAFAAHFTESPAFTMTTDLTIWREPARSAVFCSDAVKNSQLPVAEVVRFDEHENPTTFAPEIFLAPQVEPTALTSRTPVTDERRYPPRAGSGDAGGWLFLNLHNDGVLPSMYTAPHVRPTQNWVTVSMSAEGRFSVEMDANPLGNGCSSAPALSSADHGPASIGPLRDGQP